MDEKELQLDEFLKKYRKLVIHNAYSFVHDFHTAEDICQETFLRYYRDLENVDPRKVKAWLFQVSENLAKDHLKKGGRYKTDVGLDDVMLDTPDRTYPDPANIMVNLEDTELRKRVLEKLKNKKPVWYEILLLCEVEGKTNEDLGEIYGVSPALISKWKERGRSWLRENYELEEERRARKKRSFYFS